METYLVLSAVHCTSRTQLVGSRVIPATTGYVTVKNWEPWKIFEQRNGKIISIIQEDQSINNLKSSFSTSMSTGHGSGTKVIDWKGQISVRYFTGVSLHSSLR